MNYSRLLLPLFLVSFTFARPQQIESLMSPAPKTIDCNLSDWNNKTVALSENENCFVSFANNDSTLSMCLVSKDRDLNRQIMMNVLKLSFKGTRKGKNVFFGITYPIGMMAGNMKPPSKNDSFDTDAINAMEEQMLQSLMISGPTTDGIYPMSRSVADSFGIHVSCRNSKDSFIYELNIPLYKGTPVTDSISLITKSSLHLTIATIKPLQRSSGQMPPEGNSDGRSAPPPGGPMGGPPNGGNPPNGRGPQMAQDSDPFSADLLIKLFSDK